MPRGITEKDVFTTCDALVLAGERPNGIANAFLGRRVRVEEGRWGHHIAAIDVHLQHSPIALAAESCSPT